MRKIFCFLTFLIFSCYSTVPCFAELVMFNTVTLKFHAISCSWAKKCTKNCIKIDRKEAIRRGGVPCKVCGG